MRSPPSASVSFPGLQRQGSPRGRVRLASSRGGSSHNDPYGDEERDFGAGFECHLAVVRAIVVELSPGRCDGAPRGLDASTRDRDRTTTCGTFALGLGTTPEDTLGVCSHFAAPLCIVEWLGVTQNARNRVLLLERSGSCTVAALRH